MLMYKEKLPILYQIKCERYDCHLKTYLCNNKKNSVKLVLLKIFRDTDTNFQQIKKIAIDLACSNFLLPLIFGLQTELFPSIEFLFYLLLQ